MLRRSWNEINDWRTGGKDDLSSPPPVDPPAAAPAPAPVPQYYTSATIPMNLSEFAHGSISSLPHSVTASFEPTGPTPPVSAAGSPSDPTPSPVPSTYTDEVQSPPNAMDVNFPSVSQSKSMTPVTPSSTISTPVVSTPLFPAFNSPAFASGQEWGNASAFAVENHETFIPAPTSSSLWEDMNFHQQQQQQQQQQFEPSQGQYMATEATSHVGCLSDPLVVCSDIRLIGESVLWPRACSFDECFCGKYDPLLSAFGSCMGTVNPGWLLTDPGGTVDLNGAFSETCSDESGLGVVLASLRVDDLPTAAVEENVIPHSYGDAGASVVYEDRYEGSGLNVGCNPDDFFDLNAPSMFIEERLIAHEERYVPPAGAGNSWIRRVGGQWETKTRPQ